MVLPECNRFVRCYAEVFIVRSIGGTMAFLVKDRYKYNGSRGIYQMSQSDGMVSRPTFILRPFVESAGTLFAFLAHRP